VTGARPRPDRPPLRLIVLVGGAPGSGKTTLARRLGPALALPVVAKDDFKESLLETLGAPDRAASAALGRAAIRLLYTTGRRVLEAGGGVILESNFYPGLAEPDLAPLLRLAPAVQLLCGGDPETISRRYVERHARGERHPGHFDAVQAPLVRRQLLEGTFRPLDLDAPALRVDTTGPAAGGYDPSFDAILDFVARAARPAADG
jgi:predicted kinase